jgi:hypothetical protein
MTSSQHTAAQSVSQRSRVEVDEQADATSAEPQIGEKLSLIQRRQTFHRFDFDNHFAGNDDVHAVPTVQLDVIVENWKWNLAPVWDTCAIQFMAQACLVDGFQKTGPKPAVHAHGKANDLAADVRAVHKTGVSVHAPDHRGTRLTADECGAAMQARINTDYAD